MKEGEELMVLCDPEEEYAQLMTEYLKKQKTLPWEIHTYTGVKELLCAKETSIKLLVISESAYNESMQSMPVARIIVLNESGLMKWENVCYVDKYRQADEVLREIMQLYIEIADQCPPRLRKGFKTVFLGNYSPVRRCMQTSFALTMSQLLAKEHTVLYLNFEHYAGIGQLLPDMQTLDLADLLYFLNAENEKFRLRLQMMCRHIGNLDYIPPMKSGQNLLSVTATEWINLLQKLEELGSYEYVILDLSESMQGVFEILRLCRRIYTMTCEDRIAKSKLLQYEQLLSLHEYGDVLDKTRRVSLTHIRQLPEEPEQLTRGELAALVNDLLKEGEL